MTTPPQNQTELEKAIEEAARYINAHKLNLRIDNAFCQIICAAKRLNELEKERDEFKSMLEHIAFTHCGITIGKPLEGIDEAETDVSMVAAFVEGQIDEQAFRADKFEQELSQLRASYDAVNSRMIETICERDTLCTEYKNALEALKEISTWLRALRHSMDSEKPFPSVEKVSYTITQAETVLSTPAAIAMKG